MKSLIPTACNSNPCYSVSLVFFCNDLSFVGLFSVTNFQGELTSLVAPKSNGAKCEAPSSYGRPPCFARPARKESKISNSVAQSMTKTQGYDFDAFGPPTFARPNKQIKQGEQLNNEKRINHSEIGDYHFEL